MRIQPHEPFVSDSSWAGVENLLDLEKNPALKKATQLGMRGNAALLSVALQLRAKLADAKVSWFNRESGEVIPYNAQTHVSKETIPLIERMRALMKQEPASDRMQTMASAVRGMVQQDETASATII